MDLIYITNNLFEVGKVVGEYKPVYTKPHQVNIVTTKFYLEGLNHLFFEIIFLPYLIKVVKENNNSSQINQLYNFLEEMIVCEDLDVQEVAVISVLEPLYFEKMREIDTYKQYFRSNTSTEFSSLLKYYKDNKS